MKRLIQLVMVLAPLSGCAHATAGSGGSGGAPGRLWVEGFSQFSRNEFATAESSFVRLHESYPETLEGRESLFYIGVIKLDPRNPGWDSRPAEERLKQYLAYLEDPDGPRLFRYPEAATLHEIARQLNLPPESRVGPLQPAERVVEVPDRVVVPGRESRELADEVARLREQVADRDARIRQQQEELERIRRTLTAPSR
jgi:hypothetical protein